MIADQTQHFVEGEFGTLFNPPRTHVDASNKDHDLPFGDDSFFTDYNDRNRDDDDNEDYDDDNDHAELRIPILNITPA